MTQMAIRDVNGLAVLVNILRTDHINCQVKKEGLPLTGFKVGLLPNRFSLKRGEGGGDYTRWGIDKGKKTLPFRHSTRTFQGVRNNPPSPSSLNVDQFRLVSQRFLRVEKGNKLVKCRKKKRLPFLWKGYKRATVRRNCYIEKCRYWPVMECIRTTICCLPATPLPPWWPDTFIVCLVMSPYILVM